MLSRRSPFYFGQTFGQPIHPFLHMRPFTRSVPYLSRDVSLRPFSREFDLFENPFIDRFDFGLFDRYQPSIPSQSLGAMSDLAKQTLRFDSNLTEVTEEDSNWIVKMPIQDGTPMDSIKVEWAGNGKVIVSSEFNENVRSEDGRTLRKIRRQWKRSIVLPGGSKVALVGEIEKKIVDGNLSIIIPKLVKGERRIKVSFEDDSLSRADEGIPDKKQEEAMNHDGSESSVVKVEQNNTSVADQSQAVAPEVKEIDKNSEASIEAETKAIPTKEELNPESHQREVAEPAVDVEVQVGKKEDLSKEDVSSKEDVLSREEVVCAEKKEAESQPGGKEVVQSEASSEGNSSTGSERDEQWTAVVSKNRRRRMKRRTKRRASADAQTEEEVLDLSK